MTGTIAIFDDISASAVISAEDLVVIARPPTSLWTTSGAGENLAKARHRGTMALARPGTCGRTGSDDVAGRGDQRSR